MSGAFVAGVGLIAIGFLVLLCEIPSNTPTVPTAIAVLLVVVPALCMVAYGIVALLVG